MDGFIGRLGRSGFKPFRALAAMEFARVCTLTLLLAASLSAQFVTNVTQVPKNSRIPVVFVNGYQLACPSGTGTLAAFRSTFGNADLVLGAENYPVLFFDNCSVPNSPRIEVLGNSFGQFIRSLRYADGTEIPAVDVVAHSMGGLIVRSYLAGKQVQEGVFTPPVPVRVRKIVFLGTPHFGSILATLATLDTQIEQLRPGSSFLFELATWNQGRDDLRGLEALNVLGNAGNASLGSPARFHDSTVALTHGSLNTGVSPGNTRVLNQCHTTGAGEFACTGQEGYLAQIGAATQPNARIITSFFSNTNTWAEVGEAGFTNFFLRQGQNLDLRVRDERDQPSTINSVTAPEATFNVRASGVATSVYVPLASPITVQHGSGRTLTLPALGALKEQARELKLSTAIAAIIPAFSVVVPRGVAPGMAISLYGADLAGATGVVGDTQVLANGQPIQTTYISPLQINAVLPDNLAGTYAEITVRRAASEHTIGTLVEPSIPSLYPSALNAITGTLVDAANPIPAGQYITLYLTGLGRTELRGGLQWAIAAPEVTLSGGAVCELQYAGRNPMYAGLDQINCRVPPNTPAGTTQIHVRVGQRVASIPLYTRLP